MKTVSLDGLERLGFGSFFVCFRLSRTRVLKVPSMYDSWPTNECQRMLADLDMTAEEYLAIDSLKGSRLPGALPVIDVVEVVGANLRDSKPGLVFPYARMGNVGRQEINKFNERYPHWKWDANPTNYGRYHGDVVRVDTQRELTEKLFEWV